VHFHQKFIPCLTFPCVPGTGTGAERSLKIHVSIALRCLSRADEDEAVAEAGKAEQPRLRGGEEQGEASGEGPIKMDHNVCFLAVEDEATFFCPVPVATLPYPVPPPPTPVCCCCCPCRFGDTATSQASMSRRRVWRHSRKFEWKGWWERRQSEVRV
jgi:hypothetical protein